jgi:hypothetical protein
MEYHPAQFADGMLILKNDCTSGSLETSKKSGVYRKDQN